MSYFVSQPITIREVSGMVIEQAGDQALINGVPASMTTRDTILANRRHYLRDALRAVMDKIETGELAAVVHGEPRDGKPTYILITAEQFALGAPERARWAEFAAGQAERRAGRVAAEHAFDLANNEGGEGYNPHRQGAERTYDRAPRRDRDYPVGA